MTIDPDCSDSGGARIVNAGPGIIDAFSFVLQLSFFIASRFGDRANIGDSCVGGNGVGH
jgi:hypothetical protein